MAIVRMTHEVNVNGVLDDFVSLRLEELGDAARDDQFSPHGDQWFTTAREISDTHRREPCRPVRLLETGLLERPFRQRWR
jgi:hypothetical protein